MSVLDYTPKPWEPMQRFVPDIEEVARLRRLVEAEGGDPDGMMHDEEWANAEYNCFVRFLGERGRAGVVHLSIKRTDGQPANDWREKQAIKNDVIGWEREAVEIYPAESRLVDQADQSHLWVMPVGENVGIGFPARDVKTDVERKRDLGKVSRKAAAKGSQREWRPGISTGPNYSPGGDA